MTSIDHPLGFLVGTWEGVGAGEYPSVPGFSYVEVLEIGLSPKGFLTHSQRTRHVTEGTPMHAEMGYWRIVGAGHVELVLAHPSGVTEICEGTVDSHVVHVRSVLVGCASTAKPVQSLERWYSVEGDVLRYRLSMGAMGLIHQPHLVGELQRAF